MSDLYDPRINVRGTDPSTSHAAAQAAAPMANTQIGKILACFDADEELTQSDVALRVGLHRHQVNKRLADLARKGVIELTGEERVGEANRRERVWRMRRP